MTEHHALRIIEQQIETLGRYLPQLKDMDQEVGQIWADLQQEFSKLSQSIRQTDQILGTTTAIADTTDTVTGPDELSSALVHLIADRFAFEQVALYLTDETQPAVKLIAQTDQSSIDPVIVISEHSSVQHALSYKEAIIANYNNGTSYSQIYLPLVIRDESLGLLLIRQVETETGRISAETLPIMRALAAQVAQAIQNSQIFSTVDQQLEQLATLYHISLQVGSHLNINLQINSHSFNFDTLLGNIAQLCLQLTQAEASIVRLTNLSGEDPAVVQAVAVSVDGTSTQQAGTLTADLSYYVAETNQPILANDWSSHELAGQHSSGSITGRDILALIAVPIVLRGRCVGTMEVQHYAKARPFTENDLHILTLLASQAAVAIENTHLFNQAESNSHFLKTIIEHIPDPIFIKDRNHTWIEMNQANANVIGQPTEVLIGKSDQDFFPEKLAHEFYTRDNLVFDKNQSFTFEDRTTWSDGQEHVAYTRLIPISSHNGDPEFLLGISHDVTERRAQEAERERLLNEMSTLYEGSRAIAEALSERQVFEALFKQIQFQKPDKIQAYYFKSVAGKPIWVELMARWIKDQPITYPSERRHYLPDLPAARWLVTPSPVYFADIATDERLSDLEREQLAKSNEASLAILPLLATGYDIGVVLIYFNEPTQFSNKTKRFWQAMVDQASVLLVNRQLIQEVASRAVQIETAADVARTASSILDVGQLLNSAVKLIQERFRLYYVGVFLVDEHKEWAVLRAGTGTAGAVQIKENHRLKIGGESMIGWCLAHHRAKIALDVGQEAVHFQNPHLPETRSEMALPLIYRSEAIGALTIQSTEPAAFSQADIIFSQTMADQLATAIENARLFEKAQQEILERKRIEREILERNNELAAINRVSKAVASSLDQQNVLRSAAQEIAQIFSARACGVALLNEDQTESTIVAEYTTDTETPNAEGVVIPVTGSPYFEQVIETLESLVIDQPQTNPLTKPIHDFMRERNTECLMIVPLTVQGAVIGTIGLDSTQPDRKFTETEVELVETIAAQIASAVENARLFEQSQDVLAEQKRIEAALRDSEERYRQLLKEAQRRSNLLGTGAEVSRTASSILEVDALINHSVNLIRDAFDFYYVGLFLIKDNWAVLRAGTGEAGRIQLENGHKLEIGGDSMIGWSVANGQARIALDVGQEAVFFENPVLPDTRSEMALPLISRDNVIGALTVQSVEPAAFLPEDVTLLQTMADQLANAIQNARFFEAVRQARAEAEERLHQTTALQKLSQALSSTLNVKEILDTFFKACTGVIGLEYVIYSQVNKDTNQVRAIGGTGVSESHLRRTNYALDSDNITAYIVKQGEMERLTGWDDRFDKEIFETEQQENWIRLFLPVTLRLENIGVVEAGFNQKIEKKISNSQVNLLRAFIDQTALALDNAQRYEASQRQARREALIKDITTKVRASTDIDTILQTAVKELGQAIEGQRPYVHLVSPSPRSSER